MIERAWPVEQSLPPSPPAPPPPPPAPPSGPPPRRGEWEEWSPIDAWSITTRGSGTDDPLSSTPKASPLAGLTGPGRARRAYRDEVQKKAELAGQRVSRSEPSTEQTALILGHYAEPPFDLDRLTEMLYHGDTYASIVKQFATDACGGWSLVDASTGKPEAGHIDPATGVDDAGAAAQRVMGEKFLDQMTLDFDDQHISVAEFSQRIIKDWDATGNAHCEIVRDESDLPLQTIHIPAKLVRRGIDGRTFAQLNEDGKPVAFFRRFGTEVKPLATVADEYGRQFATTDTPWAYVTAEEADYISAVLPYGEAPVRGQREGDLKREIADFKKYHQAERFYGVPDIIPAFNSLVGNILAANRNVRFFINRGIPDYCIMIKTNEASSRGTDGDKRVQKVVDTLSEHMRNMLEGQDHKTMILKMPLDGMEVTFEEIGGKPSDQEWGEYLKANRDNQIHVYGMQPSKIGIIETASLGTGSGETQDETYKRSQIDPRQDMLESFWNVILDLRSWTAVRFEFDEFDVLDEQRDSTIGLGWSATGAFSINEIRAMASRVMRDQDYLPDDHELADVPIKILDYMMAGLAAQESLQSGVVVPQAAGYPGRSRVGRFVDRLGELTGLRGYGGNEGALDALTRARANAGRIGQASPPATVPPAAPMNGGARGRQAPVPAR